MSEATQRSLRIAVIADTHDQYPADLPDRLKGADEIWHLGDVCQPEVLDAFEGLGPRVRVVLGNNDSYHGWPLNLLVELQGVRMMLVHIPPLRVPRGVVAVLHGHTHVPRDEVRRGVRWLNPGCISYPNRGAPASFAWLSIANGAIAGWDLVYI